MRRTKLLKTVPIDKLMDLKVDFAFKQLFGIEKNKHITIVFLNAVLQRTGSDRIVDIAFENTEAGGEYEEDKQSRLDLLVTTDAGEVINIEMQFTNKYDMVKRSIYYWAGVYRRPFSEGMGYKELSPVIAINIMNFNLFNQTDRFHTTYHLHEDTEKFKLTDVMEFHFIEMKKLIRDWQANKLDPWNDLLARWLLLLGVVDRRNGKVYEDIFKELEEIAMEDDQLHDAIINWGVLSGTKEQMIAYEGRMKRIIDEEAAARELELGKQELKQKEQALEQKEHAMEQKEHAIEQKERDAVQKVQAAELRAQEAEKAAELRQQEITQRLLAKGMDIKMVAEITGFTEAKVQEISEQLNNL